jgi:hypothetical protein
VGSVEEEGEGWLKGNNPQTEKKKDEADEVESSRSRKMQSGNKQG